MAVTSGRVVYTVWIHWTKEPITFPNRAQWQDCFMLLRIAHNLKHLCLEFSI